MKKTIWLITIIVSLSISAIAQCSDADKKALEAFDRDWGKSSVSGDKAALMVIYADDYVGLPAMESKTSAIAGAMKTYEVNKANPAGADKVTYDHYMISCTPNTATITHRNTVWTPNGSGGKPETFYTRSVHILEKRGGKWQVVSNAGGGLDDYAVLWYLEQDWNNAILKKNRAWFESTFAPDFTSVSSRTAQVMNRAEDIADTVDPKTTIDVAETTDMDIKIDGDFAVITGTFRIKGKDPAGVAFDRKIRYTDTWIRRGGKWHAWSSQGTNIPESTVVASQ